MIVDYGQGENVLFTGTLTQYSLCSKGDLETLYLTGTSRYKKHEGGRVETKKIPGDCFVIPYNRVLNMNIDYVIETINEAKREGKVKRVLLRLFSGLLILLLPIIFVAPWFTEVGIVEKIASTAIFFLSWLFFMVGYVNLNDKKDTLKPKAIWISFGVCLILLLLGLHLLGLIDFLFFLKRWISGG